jgi:hypothetical protein
LGRKDRAASAWNQLTTVSDWSGRVETVSIPVIPRGGAYAGL